MANSKILIVYFSRTGTTAEIAHELRQALRRCGVACDVESLAEVRARGGIRGYLRSAIDSILDRRSALLPPDHDPAFYDLVVVGTPIWNADVSTPIRTFLRTRRGQLPRLAWFLAYGGSGRDRVMRRMARLAGKEPIATLAVREGELAKGWQHRAIDLFAERLAAAVNRDIPRADLPNAAHAVLH